MVFLRTLPMKKARRFPAAFVSFWLFRGFNHQAPLTADASVVQHDLQRFAVLAGNGLPVRAGGLDLPDEGAGDAVKAVEFVVSTSVSPTVRSVAFAVTTTLRSGAGVGSGMASGSAVASGVASGSAVTSGVASAPR
jgi:hypothetical protein